MPPLYRGGNGETFATNAVCGIQETAIRSAKPCRDQDGTNTVAGATRSQRSAAPRTIAHQKLCTRDVAWAMCHMPRVVLVDARIGYADLHARMLQSYMHEHYNETVELDRLYDGSSLTLQSCRLKHGDSGE